jgi:uncharacterized membrane protein
MGSIISFIDFNPATFKSFIRLILGMSNPTKTKVRDLRRGARIATWICLLFLAIEYLTGKWLSLNSYHPPYSDEMFVQWASTITFVTDLHMAVAVVIMYAGVAALTCGALAGLHRRTGGELAGGLLAVLVSSLLGLHAFGGYGFTDSYFVAVTWLAAVFFYVMSLMGIVERG